MSAVIIRTDGTRVPFKPQEGRRFTLRELQEAVGGFIEVLYLPDGRAIVMDEEGKYKPTAINPMATLLASGRIAESDAIKGDVVVCSADMLKG